MLDIEILPRKMWPEGLLNIPYVPKKLWVKGLSNFQRLLDENYKFLTIVGSRNLTDYGEEACKKLISGLSGYKICIVSGLAYGIDSLAHRVAIENAIPTIAFPGSGLHDSVIYPKGNFELAQNILDSGGVLISEFHSHQEARPWMFPQRNRLMVGISHATLIIEAGEKSGSGISANMAVEYDRELLVVPGSIFNHNSEMCNRLIKSGANVVTDSFDILQNLHFKLSSDSKDFQTDLYQNSNYAKNNLNGLEAAVLKYIQNGLNDKEEILKKMNISISKLNRIISKLEIFGLL